VSKICDIWDRSPDNEGYRQIIVWLKQGFTPSDILVLVPSLKTAHRVEYYKRFYPIWYIQLPAYEGRHRRRSRSKFIPQQSTILYFPRMQRDGSGVLVLCSTNNVVGSARATNVTTALSCRHDPKQFTSDFASRSPSSTSTMYQGDVRGGLTENHFDVSDNSTMANYAMKLRTAVGSIT
jgi:hypothetical protein